jgi:hypothetical protein
MGSVEGKLPQILPLLVIKSDEVDFRSNHNGEKRKAPGKTGGLALTSLGGDPLRRYIKQRELNKMRPWKASIISPPQAHRSHLSVSTES